MTIDLERLRAPFPPNEIEWRVGSTTGDKKRGLALAYLTSWHVMNRLDEVCGIDGWQDRYEFHGPRTVCYLSLKIGDEWITKADAAGDTQVESEKGSVSDALKRAAVKWGIGRYLYTLGNTWVELEPAGRSYKIKEHEYPRLEKMLQQRFGGKPSDAPREEAPPIDGRDSRLSKTDARPLFERLQAALRKCKTTAAYDEFWQHEKTIAARKTLPEDWERDLIKMAGEHVESITEKEAA